MAISSFQPMLLLLASFFFLPALRAIDFEYCNKSGYAYGNITRVDISPNPVGPNDDPSITFYGSANNSSDNIYQGKIDVSVKSWGDSGTLAIYDIYDDRVIEHGTNFVFTVINVPHSEANKGKVKVSLTLIDALGLYDVKPGPVERICIDFYFPAKTRKSLRSSS